MKIRPSLRVVTLAGCLTLAGCDKNLANGSSESHSAPAVVDEKAALANFQAEVNAVSEWLEEKDKSIVATGPEGSTAKLGEMFAKLTTIKTDGLPPDLKGAWNEMSGLYAEMGALFEDIPKPDLSKPENSLKMMQEMISKTTERPLKIRAINEKMKPVGKKVAELCRKYGLDMSKVARFIPADSRESGEKMAKPAPATGESADALEAREMKAVALAREGKLAEAEEEFSDLLAIRMRVLGPEHPDTQRSDKYQSTTRFRRVRPPGDVLVLDRWERLATTLVAQGRITQGVEEFQELLSLIQRVYGSKSIEADSIRIGFGRALLDQRKFVEAEKVFRASLAESPESPIECKNLAICLEAQGKKEEALKFARLWLKSCRDMDAKYGGESSGTQDAKKLVEKLEKPVATD